MIKFLDLVKQYQSIKQDIDAAIAAVLQDSAFVGGKYVQQFEEAFAAYQQTQYCVGVGNGTDAIEIALEALALPPQSEIIVPANSFIASSEAVTRTGHRVVFCDCDPQTYTIDLADCQRRITPQTRAIIAVHLYGHPADLDALQRLAQQHDLKLIEDCAQAHGAEYKGRRVGSFGDVGTFSFYPGKNLGAYGDAGAIVTNHEALAVQCRMIANHGRIGKYEHAFEARNSRLDGLQAAILNVKLRYLEQWINARRTVATAYYGALMDVAELTLPQEAAWAKHVYHLFVIRHPQRDRLQQYLEAHQIQTGIHYPIALPKLPAYHYLHQDAEPLAANRLDGELLSLPMGEHLTAAEVALIAKAIAAFTQTA